MQKEIFEQPESVVNTMRGRVNFENNTGETSCAQISESFPDQMWVKFIGSLQFLRNNYMDLTRMVYVFRNIYQLTLRCFPLHLS